MELPVHIDFLEHMWGWRQVSSCRAVPWEDQVDIVFLRWGLLKYMSQAVPPAAYFASPGRVASDMCELLQGIALGECRCAVSRGSA